MKHAFPAARGDPAATRVPLAKKLAEAGGHTVRSASSGVEAAGRAVLAVRNEA